MANVEQVTGLFEKLSTGSSAAERAPHANQMVSLVKSKGKFTSCSVMGMHAYEHRLMGKLCTQAWPCALPTNNKPNTRFASSSPAAHTHALHGLKKDPCLLVQKTSTALVLHQHTLAHLNCSTPPILTHVAHPYFTPCLAAGPASIESSGIAAKLQEALNDAANPNAREGALEVRACVCVCKPACVLTSMCALK